MSQSAILYAISSESFAIIEKARGKTVRPRDYTMNTKPFKARLWVWSSYYRKARIKQALTYLKKSLTLKNNWRN
jgi:hypothetical protein